MKATIPIRSDFTMWFQIKYCLAMITSIAVTSLVIYLYFRHGLGEGYAEALVTLTQLEESLPIALLMTFIAQSLIILFFSVAINLFVSHKIAGPIYRFEHSLRCIVNGDLQHVARTRDSDQIQSMVSALNRLIASLRSIFMSLHGVEHNLNLLIRQMENGEKPDLRGLRQKIAQSRTKLGSTKDGGVDE